MVLEDLDLDPPAAVRPLHRGGAFQPFADHLGELAERGPSRGGGRDTAPGVANDLIPG